MKTNKLVLFFSATLTFVVVFSGCSKPGNPVSPDNSSSSNTVLAPITKQIEIDPNFSSVQVDSNGLKFSFKSSSGMPSINMGDILIGPTNNGYIRKVISVSSSGNTITVITTNASLDEAFSKVYVDTTIRVRVVPSLQKISSISINKEIQGKGGTVLYKVTSDKPSFAFDNISAQLKYSFPNLNFELKSPDEKSNLDLHVDSVTLELAVTTHLYFNLDNSSKSFVLTYQVTTSLVFTNVSMTMNGTIDAQNSDGDDLLPQDILLASVPVLGPMVSVNFYLNIAGGIEGEFQMGAGTMLTNSTTTTSSYTVGAEFLNGAWSPVWETNSSGNSVVNFRPIANISGLADVFIEPKLRAKIDGFFGPGLFVKGYLYGKVSDPPLDASVGLGLGGGLSFDVGLFSENIASFEWTLADKEWPFWEKTYTNLPSDSKQIKMLPLR